MKFQYKNMTHALDLMDYVRSHMRLLKQKNKINDKKLNLIR